jgi:hypothetical protein
MERPVTSRARPHTVPAVERLRRKLVAAVVAALLAPALPSRACEAPGPCMPVDCDGEECPPPPSGPPPAPVTCGSAGCGARAPDACEGVGCASQDEGGASSAPDGGGADGKRSP